MVTGFDIWGHDPSLRRHWRVRFAAFIIDAVIAFVPTSLILYFLNIEEIILVGLVNSVVFYLLSSVPESLTGASAGKRVMGLRVYPTTGDSLAGKACLRNIPRFFWFALPPLDFAAGMATRGDPRQKMFDRLAGTKVVHFSETERYENALKTVSEGEKKENDDSKDACQECGGKLMLLPDEKLQCEKCGLIQ
ncbi:MAG: RDD family protein [Thermoplasmata archaeon]